MKIRARTERTRRSFLSVLASTAGLGARLLVQVLVTPYVVSRVGTDYYGVWAICLQFLSQMGATEGGSMQTLKFTIANKQGHGNVSEKLQDVGSAVLVWICFFPVMVVIGIVFVWQVPSFLGNVTSQMTSVARLTIALLVVNFVLSTLIKLPQAILIGENLEYKAIRAEISTIVIGNGVFVVLAIYFGLGIVGLALATILTTFMTGSLYFFVARRNVPWIGLERPTTRHFRSFFSISVWVMGWTLTNKLILSTDLILLGYASNPQVVSAYVLTLFPIASGIQIVARLSQSTIPGLGGVVGAGEFDLANRVRAEIMIVSWILVTVIGCLIIAWNESFVFNWIGPGVYAGDIVNLLMVLMVAQQIIYRNDAFIIDTTLSLQKKVLFGIGAALTTNGLGLLLALRYGMVGLLVGLILGRAILSITFPIIVATAFRSHPWKQFAGVIRPVFVMSIIWGITWYVREWLFAQSWPELIVGSILTVLGAGIVATHIGLNSAQRRRLFARLAKFRSDSRG